jgi:hypothetical protein
MAETTSVSWGHFHSHLVAINGGVASMPPHSHEGGDEPHTHEAELIDGVWRVVRQERLNG